jgi:carbon catabolite-derepressing protein kinase
MEGFMASSPPAWNAEIPRDQSEGGSDESDDDEDLDIQDIPNAHFDVLDTSRSTGES